MGSVVLVDGTYCLFRAYHGSPRLQNRKGEPTGAMLSVIRTLRRLRDSLSPDYLAVVFDAGGPSFRHNMYADYKANRPPMPEELAQQTEPLRELIRAQALPLLVVPGVEADDVIGTLAIQGAAAGMEVLIVSADKDFTQLVDDRIALFHPGHWQRRDRAWVQKEFSVAPELMIDYLTLVGDASDNIPGVSGIGPKTASRLLQKYGGLEAILAAADTVPGKVGEKLRASRDEIADFRTLVTLKTDVALEDYPLAALRPGQADRQRLRQLYQRWDFRSLLAELGDEPESSDDTSTDLGGTARSPSPSTAGAGSGSGTGAGFGAGTGSDAGSGVGADAGAGSDAGAGAESGTMAPPGGMAESHADARPGVTARSGLAETRSEAMAESRVDARAESSVVISDEDLAVLQNAEQLGSWLSGLAPGQPLALSVQGDSRDSRSARLLGIALATAPKRAAWLSLSRAANEAPALDKLAPLLPLLKDQTVPKLGHDLKYDQRLLQRHGIALSGDCHDTMLESCVVNNVQAASHALDALAETWLGCETLRYRKLAGLGSGGSGAGEQGASGKTGDKGTSRKAGAAGPSREPPSRIFVALCQQADDHTRLDDAYRAAAEQAAVIQALHRVLHQALEADASLDALYREVEQPLLHVLARMEARGILLDAAPLEQKTRQRMQALEQEAQALCGQSVDMTSPNQLRKLLFGKLRLPVVEKTRKGQPSVAESVLQALAEQGHALPRRVLEHHGLKRRLATLSRLSRHRDAATGRVHGSYCQLGEDSGRLGPDRKDLLAPDTRPAFASPPGRLLLAAGYLHLKERVMAHLSADELLLEAFAGEDGYERIAVELFGEQDPVSGQPLGAALSEERDAGQHPGLFGEQGAVSGQPLAQQLRLARKAVSSPIHGGSTHEKLSGLRRYLRGLRARAHRQGYVETLFQRRLYLPGLQASDDALQRRAERDAGRLAIEGSAADIVRRAMIAIDTWLAEGPVDAELVMLAHDELIVEVAESDIDRARQEIEQRMTAVITLTPPLKVTMTWGERLP